MFNTLKSRFNTFKVFFRSSQSLRRISCLHLLGLTTISIPLAFPRTVSICDTKTPSIKSATAIPSPLSSSIVNEFRSILKPEQIDLDDDNRRVKGKPWNCYHSSQNYPQVILIPETTLDVSNIMKICHKYSIPVVPFGGGTSLEGHTLAQFGGVSLDFNNMVEMLEFNEVDLDCTVQAGLGYISLNEILDKKKCGLWFPLDPGPGASIGGMCACRCSGSTAVRYGSMRENVLNVTAVLADGTIIKTGSRARKSSAGYDLTRLLIGSEGTLAVITEVTLKLHNRPKISYAMRISFDDVVSAAATARDTLGCGVQVGRCELLDTEMVAILNGANQSKSVPKWPVAHTLMYEITGLSDSSVREQMNVVTDIARKHGGHTVIVATQPEECSALWRMRKEAIWSCMSTYPTKEPMITDVCVPLSRLPEMIAQAKEITGRSAFPCPIVAHAGDGNIHVVIMFDPNSEVEVKEAKKLASDMVNCALSMGGTCTGEHGIGVGKMDHLVEEMGPGSMKVMTTIKQSLDPDNILNPGKVLKIPPPSITLRKNHSCL